LLVTPVPVNPFKIEASTGVADVVLVHIKTDEQVPPIVKNTFPLISQSPAVKLIDVTSLAVAVVHETADPDVTVDDTYSPTNPVAALSFVPVPSIFTAPVPCPLRFNGILVSDPVAPILGPNPVAWLVITRRFTALAVDVKLTICTPLASKIPAELLNLKVSVIGVVNVGDVDPTNVPVPVSPVRVFPTALIAPI
jgi:hypothetical protein